MKAPSPVLLLNKQTISELLTLDECIVAVEGAFAAHAQSRALTPGLLHVDADRGEFHIKVGGLRGTHTYFATKVGAGFFNNQADFGLPNITALILLADGNTGKPK